MNNKKEGIPASIIAEIKLKQRKLKVPIYFRLGTEAWVDASGFLRQKDYIADKDGYRILKSKTIFIGKNRPIKVSICRIKEISEKTSMEINR